ncbi:hypothetical protein L1049_012059 [Liquidambar formosana]|uniref:Uncharacterized protein n=1 Tax=Liquidambar formosana TaxID=63359 RepID=A0AAP0RZ91_LIQFO
MKDLLKRKPSLAELTGISEPRLDCFATHLRAFLVGSTVTNTRASSAVTPTASSDSALDPSELSQGTQFASSLSKAPRSRQNGSQAVKANSLYQGSLSPRSSSFKEGLPRNLSSLKSVAREMLRRRGDCHISAVENVPVASPIITTDASCSNHSEDNKLPEFTGVPSFSSNFLESLGRSPAPPILNSTSQVPSIGSSLFSPYYCWCPPRPSTLQYTVAPPQLPFSSTESLSLPPLSSLLPTTRSSSSLTPTPPFNLANVPSTDFPAFLPDPLVRFPFSMPSSQQIPTFTPLMCDSIVHIPFIDVCSSGQGYLVSAGPAISAAIPPLHPTLVNPLIPETDSVMEKGARETLRLLISSSSQANPQLMNVLPAVLTNADDNQSILVAGSRGLYNGTRDVDAIANSIAALGLVSLSGRSIEAMKKCSTSHGNLDTEPEKSSGVGGSGSDDKGSDFSDFRDERID